MSIMTKRALQELDPTPAKEKILSPDPEVWAKFLKEQEIRSEELMAKIAQYIYPTNQIMDGEITVKEYIKEIADCLVNELESRRLPKGTLPLFVELIMLNN